MITNMPSGNTADQSLPSSSYTRILSLDVLRGIAVLAALLVTIWVFGGFNDNQQKQLLLQHKGWNYRVFAAIELLLNGKMRALIALVFGAAMILFLTKSGKEGRAAAVDVFIKRHLWLIIFGLVNAMLFLWPQDILFPLGIMGILFFPFVRLSPRNLFIAAILITFIYSAKNYWNYDDDKTTYHKYLVATGMEKKFEKDSIANSQKNIIHKKDTLTKLQKQDKTAWEGRLSSMKVDVKKDDPNIKAMRSNDYGKTWNYLLPGIEFREAFWTYRTGIWDLASMIFFGMFLYKIGFFTNRFSSSRYLLIGLIGIVAGLLCGWYRLHFQQIALQDYEKYINHYALPHTFLFPLERAFIALAYTSFVLMFLAAGLLNGIWKTFAAVGKLSLTNYFLQTIICTIFFYGYGMGYYGRLTQWQLYLFAAEVIMVQIVFSVIWLRYFNYGPFEWLLRRISSGKWIKNKMSKPPATNPEISVL